MDGSFIINLILNDLGIKAPTFAKNIGVNYQRILDIQRGKTKKISDALASVIIEKYPQYNRIWLLTGDGERFKNSTSITQHSGDNSTNIANSSNINVEKIKDLERIIESQKDMIDMLKEIIKRQNKECSTN